MSKLNSTSLTTASSSLKFCKGYSWRHLNKLGWELSSLAGHLNGERNPEWRACRASAGSYLKMDSLGSQLPSAEWEEKAQVLSLNLFCLVSLCWCRVPLKAVRWCVSVVCLWRGISNCSWECVSLPANSVGFLCMLSWELGSSSYPESLWKGEIKKTPHTEVYIGFVPWFFLHLLTQRNTDRGFEAARDFWPCRGPAKGFRPSKIPFAFSK